MEKVILVALVVINLISICLCWYKISKKPKIFGQIIMHDENSMYLELDNKDTLNQIYNSDYAIFAVKRNSHQ